MARQAIAAGANGLLFYSWFDLFKEEVQGLALVRLLQA